MIPRDLKAEGWGRGVGSKRRDSFRAEGNRNGKGLTRQITPLTSIEQFQTDWFEIPLLRVQLGWLQRFGLLTWPAQVTLLRPVLVLTVLVPAVRVPGFPAGQQVARHRVYLRAENADTLTAHFWKMVS